MRAAQHAEAVRDRVGHLAKRARVAIPRRSRARTRSSASLPSAPRRSERIETGSCAVKAAREVAPTTPAPARPCRRGAFQTAAKAASRVGARPSRGCGPSARRAAASTPPLSPSSPRSPSTAKKASPGRPARPPPRSPPGLASGPRCAPPPRADREERARPRPPGTARARGRCPATIDDAGDLHANVCSYSSFRNASFDTASARCHNQIRLINNPQSKVGTNGARAGTEALRLLSAPINVHVLQALADAAAVADRPASRSGLAAADDDARPPADADRDRGGGRRRRQDDFPGSLDFELTEVRAGSCWRWRGSRCLARLCAGGAAGAGHAAREERDQSVVEGWGTSMVRALAARPFSLTRAQRADPRPQLPLAGAPAGGDAAGRADRADAGPRAGTPYAVPTGSAGDRAAGAAARWERAPGEATPDRRLDAEAAFLLRPAAGAARRRRPASDGSRSRSRPRGERRAGVWSRCGRDGSLSCVAEVQGHADSWATGSAPAWLRAVIEGDAERLEIGGESQLTRALIDGLSGALFGIAQGKREGGA